MFDVWCAVRRSQWSGAKALVKLIKPRKESSRERGGDRDKDGGKERERARSAPDIPLPAPPPLLLPETPPPLPPRTASDTQDSGHSHSNHNNHTISPSPSLGPQSPALTPISRGKRTPSPTHTPPPQTVLITGCLAVSNVQRVAHKFSKDICVWLILEESF